jgi:hypothetical protein
MPIQEKYADLLKSVKNVKEAARYQGFAKLGDEIINMSYSLAYSIYVKEATGEKINGVVLSEALKKANLRELAKNRAKTHDIADTAEALIAYCYLQQKITIDEMTEKILEGFQLGMGIPKTVQDKRDLDILGLSALLIYLNEKYLKKLVEEMEKE